MEIAIIGEGEVVIRFIDRHGHTLLQEPHSVEAKGRSAYFFMSRLGAKIEPIGPATAV